MKIKRDHVDYSVLGFLILLFVGFFTGYLGYTLVVIDNPDPNSMWPTYFQGDLFLIDDVDPGDIHVGDVVVYQKSANSVKVIHRVVDIIIHEGDYYYRVKGDNFYSNAQPDGATSGNTLIPYSEIVGKAIFRIPFLGHLSLAMQRNLAVQILVYFVAGVAALAIILWPTDEDEENEEGKFIELSFASFSTWIKGILAKPVKFFTQENGRYKSLLSIAGVLLILMLIIPLFVSGLFYTGTNSKDIGVVGINTRAYKLMQDSIDGVNYTSEFIQLEVELVDDAGIWNRIKSFDAMVYSDSSLNILLSHTKWTSFKDFSGRVIVGASIVIPSNLQPLNGSTLYVKIVTDIVTAFFFHSESVFTGTFLFYRPG